MYQKLTSNQLRKTVILIKFVVKYHSTHIALPPVVGQLISVPLYFKKKFLEEIFQEVQCKLYRCIISLKKEKVYKTFPFYAIPKAQVTPAYQQAGNARTL
ncbi:MAG: hypothetical protein CBB72_004925 [Muricauda sp. TMED12]|nr:MAG: hypothetical protein CBB72_004925 [Muricauda sp. TMED12]